MAKAKPISSAEVVEFVARHVARFPRGVIAQSLADWEKAVAAERNLLQNRAPGRPTAPKSGHNQDSPRRIAKLLARRIRESSRDE